MRILFSPVGTTDPISKNNYKDGSMLHIARVYKPDKIILYISNEMLENQEKDDRYRYCIRQLDKFASTSTEIAVIERPDLKDVNDFDYFYKDFKEILDKYVKTLNEDDELLINISSGTPQMKSGLAVLQTMLEYSNCKLIQVSTPEKRSNEHYTSRDENIEELWNIYIEYNGVESFENRCKEVIFPSLSTIKMEEIIKKHILAYDYAAALSIAEELPQKSTESYIHLLRYAKARLQLNEIEVNNIKSANNECDFLPVKKSEQRKIVEYTLALDVKRKREEYADFLRAITPLLVELFANILKNCFGIDLNPYTETVKGEFRWNGRMPDGILGQAMLEGRVESKYSVTSNQLYIIIDNLPKRDNEAARVFEIIKTLRDVEREIRNKAAHQMVSVTDEKIKKFAGMTSSEIMSKLRELFIYSDINIPKQGGWNSYELMNDSIIAKISTKK